VHDPAALQGVGKRRILRLRMAHRNARAGAAACDGRNPSLHPVARRVTIAGR
jgi:hypothetical protein